ncbi:hypothetical protein [Methanococcoides sp. LMO-2]|uniref:SMODS-associated and fused to various effectors domain-containing protein n=1 Tax=Methanococcoides cohabitans TaxID=3136559 RepID=A0ABU9KRE8_9EURY
MPTEFMEKHLHGSSKLINKSEGIDGNFDLFFFSVGWESRCTKIAEYDQGRFNFKSAIILSFNLNDEKGYLDSYMDKITSFAEKKSVFVNVGEAVDNYDNLDFIGRKLEKIIINHFNTLNRPLKIGFDISSCPRYFYLRILGFCLKYNITQKISFFYSEGVYKSSGKNFVHSEGDWKIVEMTDFSSSFDPEYQNFYVVAAGFEGSKYRNLIYQYEPDEIGILVPKPGFKPEYVKKSIIEYEILRDKYYIPDENIVEAPAGDAVAAWKALTNSHLNKDNYNITYLTVGPKPHVLAMGVHGFLSKNIIITYRVPDGYTRMEVEASKNFWQYDIENMIFI